jgi:non-ribosomal peptide synthetase component E (peptide arylation enzyme)
MAGTVGPPQPQQEVRLAAVSEMNYDPNGNPARGEVCFRSPALFSGYYKQPELFNEVVVDGWFHTGKGIELRGFTLCIYVLLSSRCFRRLSVMACQKEAIATEVLVAGSTQVWRLKCVGGFEML